MTTRKTKARTETQNMTVSLSLQTIKKAKILAAKRSTSISRLLSEQIEALVGAEEAYEAAHRSALSFIEHGFHFGGVVSSTRNELHAR